MKKCYSVLVTGFFDLFVTNRSARMGDEGDSELQEYGENLGEKTSGWVAVDPPSLGDPKVPVWHSRRCLGRVKMRRNSWRRLSAGSATFCVLPGNLLVSLGSQLIFLLLLFHRKSDHNSSPLIPPSSCVPYVINDRIRPQIIHSWGHEAFASGHIPHRAAPPAHWSIAAIGRRRSAKRTRHRGIEEFSDLRSEHSAAQNVDRIWLLRSFDSVLPWERKHCGVLSEPPVKCWYHW